MFEIETVQIIPLLHAWYDSIAGEKQILKGTKPPMNSVNSALTEQTMNI